MLDNQKLVMDRYCEVYDLLEPWCDESFYVFAQHNLIPGALYLIGRQQYNQNKDAIRKLVEENVIQVILSNPAEGSDTLRSHCEYVHNNMDLVKSKRVRLIGGGDMDPEWPCLQYDSFLPKIHEFDENLEAITRSKEVFTRQNKPYKFLFLNGRHRPHRKFLIDHLSHILDQSIWTNLDSQSGPVKLLDPKYEVQNYIENLDNLNNGFVKYKLFQGQWGEIYINPEPYIDTYFSLVTETVFSYPYTFRTEKLWKPIAMGHPFIVAANIGYYRDLHNLGFKTFGHLIDESFDTIENSHQRLTRISQVVEDLCKQDLDQFLNECYTICQYNQEHHLELIKKIKQEFPQRFFEFIKGSSVFAQERQIK